MANYPDNYDLNDDSDSIKLQELEPMTSSPYVHISLEPMPEQVNATEQARRQREAERQRAAERQKKALQRRKASERQRPRKPEPSLHVIIERAPEDPQQIDAGYETYDASYRNYESAPIPEPVITASPAPAIYNSQPIPERSRPAITADLDQRTPEYQHASEGMAYRADKPEPSAPSPVAMPNGTSGAWGSQPQPQAGSYPGMGGERRPKIEPLGASMQANGESSGFIKRPWSESAFNRHAANAVSAPIATAHSQNDSTSSTGVSSVTRQQNPKPATPTVTLNGFGRSSASTSASAAVIPTVEAPHTDHRPFGAPEDPYSVSHGMGSWKRNAAEAVRREQTNNPRLAQGSTVNIQMPPPLTPSNSHAADTGNIHLSRESFNNMGVPLPQQRQTTIQNFAGPHIEENALKESVMFEEPPVSLADGMKNADTKRKKRRRIIVISIIAIVLIAAGVVAFLVSNGTIKLDSTIPGVGAQQSAASSSATAGTSMSTSGGTSSSSRGSSAADQSGNVIYEYTATTSDGVVYNVNDTVTYNAEGKCQSTMMKLDFPDEASCSDFLANLERDYGSAYRLDTRSGATATVTIDISALRFDREEYEDALRYSVEELTVLKK